MLSRLATAYTRGKEVALLRYATYLAGAAGAYSGYTNYQNRNKKVIPIEEFWLLDNSDSGLLDLFTGGSFFNKASTICRRVNKVPKDVPIKIIIRTRGGGVMECEKILKKLKSHPAGYVTYVREEAFSAGTMLVLGAKEIIMDDDSYLGKIDPQMRSMMTSEPCIIYKNVNSDIIKRNYVNWALSQQIFAYMDFFLDILKLSPAVRKNVNDRMIYSNMPHFKTFDRMECREMGLPVRAPTPEEKKAYW